MLTWFYLSVCSLLVRCGCLVDGCGLWWAGMGRFLVWYSDGVWVGFGLLGRWLSDPCLGGCLKGSQFFSEGRVGFKLLGDSSDGMDYG